MTRHTARLFTTGGSQAVRLPKDFRFDADEVRIEKVGDKVILSPVRKGWDDFFAKPSQVPDDFLSERTDELPQSRDLF